VTPSSCAVQIKRLLMKFSATMMAFQIMDMHMLHADKLLPAVTQASENFNLHRICFEQTSRNRSERCYSALCSKSAVQLGENRHSSRVGACHLDSKRGLDSISWGGRRNHRERGVQGSFRNRAERRTSRSLKFWRLLFLPTVVSRLGVER
jgi:hypothetical protein